MMPPTGQRWIPLLHGLADLGNACVGEMIDYLDAHGMIVSGDNAADYQIIVRKGHPLTHVSSVNELRRDVEHNGLAILIAGQVIPP